MNHSFKLKNSNIYYLGIQILWFFSIYISLCGTTLAFNYKKNTAILPTYQLPNSLNIRYETHVMGLSGNSILKFKRTENNYDAQLNTYAKVLFKRFEMVYNSSGVLSSTGLEPIRIQEKRLNNPLFTITLDKNKQQALSSQVGILPYEPNSVDVLSVAVQLAILQQLNPRWKAKGMFQDFKAYRPSGLANWRFESQGIHTINIAGNLIETIYIKRIPINSTESLDEQHLWLDPKRYGFPIKMRFVDKKGRGADIVMVNWQES